MNEQQSTLHARLQRRPSWLGRGSGKIFSEKGECRQVLGSERLWERKKRRAGLGPSVLCFLEVDGTTAALTAR